MSKNPELDRLDVDRQQPQSVTLTLSINELNAVFAAMGELPHRVADPILRKMFAQVNEQLHKG